MITEMGVQQSNCRPVKAGTLLFSFKLSIGKMAFAGVDLYTNEAIAALTPIDIRIVDLNFLRYALSASNLALGSFRAVKGLTLNQDSLYAIKFPLPPLAEQKRIAAILNEQMAAVEKARVAAEGQLEAANALSRAYYKKEFGNITPLSVRPNPSQNNPGWKWRPLKDVARLESGHTPSRYHPEWWGGRIPWLALPDIRQLDGRFAYETSEYTNPDGINNSSARILGRVNICSQFRCHRDSLQLAA